MFFYYAQQIVFLAIDVCLFALIALRLLTPPAEYGPNERRTRKTLGFLCGAIVCLGMIHVVNPLAYLIMNHFGGGAWFGGRTGQLIMSVTAFLYMIVYIVFGVLMAAAIGQLLKSAPPEGTSEPQSNHQSSGSDAAYAPPTPQRTDWGYLLKQLRIYFFRLVGAALLLGAAPLAFYQAIPGVGVMAVVTGVGCLWLGFHRKSPLAIKYATLAEDDAQ